jgi:PAS domain S-box-containing protein
MATAGGWGRRGAPLLRKEVEQAVGSPVEAGEAYYLVDPEGRLVDCSRAACERVGYSREELLSIPVPERSGGVNLVHRLALAKFQEITDQAARSGPQIRRAFHRRSDGTLYVVEGIIRSLSTPLGRLTFVTEREPRGPFVEGSAITVDRRMIAGSGVSGELIEVVEAVAGTDATVLILGETGVGKGILAQTIHRLSARSAGPFVEVNCAALSATLLESELFGHERGAFTGAVERKQGRFEAARRGTLFLDEIGELPLELQPKLLRVLQSSRFERVGGIATLDTDARVVAATNRDLGREVAAGRFRSDLFFRLNVIPLTIPPLRERKEEIPALAELFVERWSMRLGRAVPRIPASVLQALTAYDWPGNIRELENSIERALILSPPGELHEKRLFTVGVASEGSAVVPLEEIQRRHILRALELSGWRVSGPRGAARALGLKPTTLEARMKKLGIRRQRSPVEA